MRRESHCEEAPVVGGEQTGNHANLLQEVRAQFEVSRDPRPAFAHLLQYLIELSSSRYGFFGEVVSSPEGTPLLKTRAEGTVWCEHSGLTGTGAPAHFHPRVFRPLVEQVIRTEQPVLRNDLSEGDLTCYLALPVVGGGKLLGFFGLVDAPTGYGVELIESWPDFRDLCVQLLAGPIPSSDGTLVPAPRRARLSTRAPAARGAETEHGESYSALMRGNLQFRSLVANLPGAIYRCEAGRESRVLFISDSIEKLTGYPPSDFTPEAVRSYLSVVHPEDRDMLRRKLDEGLRNREPYSIEYRIICRDESVRWVYEKGSGVFDEEGELLYLDGAIFDINKRKRAEGALRRNQFALDNCAEAVFTLAEDGKIVEANATACARLEYSKKELSSMTIEDIHPGHPPLRWPEMWKRVKDDRIVVTESVHRTRSGRLFPVEISAAYLRFEGAECVCAFVRDVTARRKAEDERRALEEKMQQAQKLESLGLLAGEIAHDFNNFLAGILGNAELALQDPALGPMTRKNLETVIRSSDQAADLCDQLMAYSGRGNFAVESVGLTDLVEGMVDLLAVSTSKHASIQYSLAPDLPRVRADASQLRQVVMNLITNAADAVNSPDEVIRVSTGLVECSHEDMRSLWPHDLPAGNYVFFQVSDTGCGMTDEDIGRIFEPFFTTKYSGRGLGLAAVQGIVRSHRGAIQVKSLIGKGTTFRILLPDSESSGAEQSAALET